MSKFCKDCKYVEADWVTKVISLGFASEYSYAKCKKATFDSRDQITGRGSATEKSYCITERSAIGVCGRAGENFEPKDGK